MPSNLADEVGWIARIIRRIERIESGALLENSSVTGGRMRFIGAVLRLDSGALLDLVGQWRFRGNGAITGDVVAEGKWTQNGAWEFNGPGDIAGNVDLRGTIRVLAGGKIQVGDVVIDPADGGKVTFPGGAYIRGGSTGGVEVVAGAYSAVVTSAGGAIGRSGRSVTVSEAGFRLDGVPSGSPGNGTAAGVYYRDGTGYMRVSTGA